MLAGCGGSELSASALEDCLEFDGFDSQSQTPALLRAQLRDFDWLQRRLFVLLVTGKTCGSTGHRGGVLEEACRHPGV